MRALVDTHSFLWFLAGDSKLSGRARDVIENLDNEILVSIASLWEIAIKVNLGKLVLARPFAEFIPEQLARERMTVLGIEIPHLVTLSELPRHHGDPFDRLIIAQGIAEGIPVISADPAFDRYPVGRLW